MDRNVRKSKKRRRKMDFLHFFCVGREKSSKSEEFEMTSMLDIDNCLQDVIIDENSHLILQCNLTNTPRENIKIFWCKDGVEIKPSKRISIFSDGRYNSLSINSVSPKDEGVYLIFFKHDAMKSISKAVLYVKPALLKLPNGVIYLEAQPRHKVGIQRQIFSSKIYVGGTIELEIRLKENKVEEFQWFKSNKALKEDDRTIILNDDKTSCLSIVNARESDSGIYFVVVKTRNGVESSCADVLVADLSPIDLFDNDLVPRIDECLKNTVEAYVGEEVRILCKVYFDNHTIFEWFRDTETLRPSQDIEIQYYNSRYVSLRFLCVSMNDAGTYNLTVGSAITGHSDTYSCELVIKKPPISRQLIPVRVEVPLDSAVAYIGSSVVFHCKFAMKDSQFCCAVWEVGAYRVERSSNKFYVFCWGSDFYLRINEVEPDMAGLVNCEICKAIPGRKPVSLCNSTANLTILPPTIGADIATGFKVRHKKPGFYYSGTKEYVPIAVTDENDISIFGESSGASTSHIETSKSQDSHDKGNESSDRKPLKNFLLQVPRLSHTAGGYVTDLVKFEVDLNATPEEEIKESWMDITYSKLDESVYWMVVTSNCPEKFKEVIVEKVMHEDADTPCGEVQRIMVILFKWHYPSNDCFIVEVLDAEDFVGSGRTSDQEFKLRDAPFERVLKFRIRAVRDLGDKNMPVYIALKKENPKLSKTPRPKILPMENFGTLFKETGQNLGRGAFGQVSLVKSFAGDYYAAKKIKTLLDKSRRQSIREYETLTILGHPKVVKMHLAFSNRQNFVMIMDYLWGGELFQRLVQEDYIKEVDVIIYVRQICEALHYIHKHNIVHMDVKPENIICHSPNTRLVKLADFGLAHVLRENHVTRAMYGTKEYVAPEVVNYDPLTTACDMWSFGVITYLLLSGVMPFSASSWNELASVLGRGQYDYGDPAFKNISDLAKDFINKLLRVQPTSRMSAARALEHQWLKEGPSRGFGSSPLKKTRNNLRDYLAKNRDRWQRAGNFVIAAQRLRNAATNKDEAEEKK